MTLTKEDIIDSIYTSTELSKARSSELIEALFEVIKETLERAGTPRQAPSSPWMPGELSPFGAQGRCGIS